jgi:hypothetical protein
MRIATVVILAGTLAAAGAVVASVQAAPETQAAGQRPWR